MKKLNLFQKTRGQILMAILVMVLIISGVIIVIVTNVQRNSQNTVTQNQYDSSINNSEQVLISLVSLLAMNSNANLGASCSSGDPTLCLADIIINQFTTTYNSNFAASCGSIDIDSASGTVSVQCVFKKPSGEQVIVKISVGSNFSYESYALNPGANLAIPFRLPTAAQTGTAKIRYSSEDQQLQLSIFCLAAGNKYKMDTAPFTLIGLQKFFGTASLDAGTKEATVTISSFKNTLGCLDSKPLILEIENYSPTKPETISVIIDEPYAAKAFSSSQWKLEAYNYDSAEFQQAAPSQETSVTTAGRPVSLFNSALNTRSYLSASCGNGLIDANIADASALQVVPGGSGTPKIEMLRNVSAQSGTTVFYTPGDNKKYTYTLNNFAFGRELCDAGANNNRDYGVPLYNYSNIYLPLENATCINCTTVEVHKGPFCGDNKLNDAVQGPDGIPAGSEVCDNGAQNGTSCGKCKPDCSGMTDPCPPPPPLNACCDGAKPVSCDPAAPQCAPCPNPVVEMPPGTTKTDRCTARGCRYCGTD